ncbi:MAG: hypothetical protein ABIL22_08325, partial [candidate division WOR-3 bacterium]
MNGINGLISVQLLIPPANFPCLEEYPSPSYHLRVLCFTFTYSDFSIIPLKSYLESSSLYCSAFMFLAFFSTSLAIILLC